MEDNVFMVARRLRAPDWSATCQDIDPGTKFVMRRKGFAPCKAIDNDDDDELKERSYQYKTLLKSDLEYKGRFRTGVLWAISEFLDKLSPHWCFTLI